MRKILFVVAASALLPGCATLGAVDVAVDRLCDRQDTVRIALNLALTQAFTITDQNRRNLVETGLRASLAALDACPIQQGSI